jgi:hypothetical protein
MPQDAPLNGSAPDPAEGPWSRVAGMQAKLHRWAAADPGRQFDDLFNFVHDPATLIVAFDRVAGNKGADTPGVDGVTAAWVEEQVGVPGFLEDLRAAVKDGSFRPLPVRERMIPKPGGSGKLRKLGIPTEPANCTVAQGSCGSGIVYHGDAPVPSAVGAAAAGAVRAEAAFGPGGQLRGRPAGLGDVAAVVDRLRRRGGGRAADV